MLRDPVQQMTRPACVQQIQQPAHGRCDTENLSTGFTTSPGDVRIRITHIAHGRQNSKAGPDIAANAEIRRALFFFVFFLTQAQKYCKTSARQ